MDDLTSRRVAAARDAWYRGDVLLQRTTPSPSEAAAWAAALAAQDVETALLELYGEDRWQQIQRGGTASFYRDHMARARRAAREVS